MLDFRNPHGLATARKAAGLSIAELARLSGVSRDTIERIEAGTNSPRLDTFLALERAIDAQARAA